MGLTDPGCRMSRGMDSASLRDLGRLIRDESDPEAREKRLAGCLKRAAPTQETGQLLRDSLDLLPENLKVLRRGAQIFMEIKDWANAAILLQRAVALEASHLKTRLRLVRSLSRQGRWEEALAAMEPVSRHPRAIWRHHVELAEIHAHLGNHKERVEALREAFSASPRDPGLQDKLIEAVRATGNAPEVDELLRRIREIPAKMSSTTIIERIAESHPGGLSRFVVNIGCRDGRSWADPCHELFRSGFGGLAVDAGDFPAIFENLPQPNVRKQLKTFVTPTNVVDVLRAAETPTTFDFLHIHIGCLEGVLLEPILDCYQPKVIHLAVNTAFPPPLKFTIHYHSSLRGGSKAGFWGCSVSFAASTTRKYGYALLQLDFSDQTYRRDVVLIKHEFLEAFGLASEPDERVLYDGEPYTPSRFLDIGVDSRRWREITDPEELLSQVRVACDHASTERYGAVVPYTLSV